jgi:pyruvate formate lyase activating enzyme
LNRSAVNLQVGGLTRLTSCDWPGQLAATIFCQGCAWDCPYCHNPGLRPAQSENLIAWPDVLEFLRGRIGLLDAVVFSGGEPLLQSALCDAVPEVRSLGFRIGLHTTGMIPERFVALLPNLDWVGFDVKAPFADFARVTGLEHSGDNALTSLKQLLAAGVAYEIRTTVHPALLNVKDLLALKEDLLRLGATSYVVQEFRTQGCNTDRLPVVHLPVILPNDFADGFLRFQIR